jgi:hypothetical protein
MPWSKVAGKMNPHYGTQLLCAWAPKSTASSWNYGVLTHWPDGKWTDDSEDEVPADELPDYWQSISPPALSIWTAII